MTKVGAGLFGASGAAAYISPKGNFKMYDMDVSEPSALSVMRCVGAWQMVLAALVTADTGDVHSLGSYLAAASILVAIPAWEVLGAPKEPMVAWIAALTAIGALQAQGKLSPWVSVFLYRINGLQWQFMSTAALDLYGVKKPSPLAVSMAGLSGSMMLVAGTYLAALANGSTQAEAFGYAYALNGASAAKWALTEAEGLGAPKHGPLAWAAISAAIAYKALN